MQADLHLEGADAAGSRGATVEWGQKPALFGRG